MRYDVPFISQFDGVVDPDWQWRGCGVVSLKMVFDYWRHVSPTNHTMRLEVLYEKGLKLGAYREGIGWTHKGLASIARELGYDSYSRDFAENGLTPKDSKQALEALKMELIQGPVLVSVYAGFDSSRKGGHIIVATGIEEDIIFFNDPEQRVERDGRNAFAIKAFLGAFKRRYIVIRPKSSF